MIRYNRFILIFRVLGLLFFGSHIYFKLPLIFNTNTLDLSQNFLSYALIPFFLFTIARLIRLIIQESYDIIINEDGITLRHIITRKKKHIQKAKIYGYRHERFKWNILKISGIRSFWDYESKMLVVFSTNRAILHLKSFNYLRFKNIAKTLDKHYYDTVSQNQTFFDKYKYRKI